MAATPYPTDYVYAGNAVALTLKTAVSDGGGDLTLTVNEETAAKGWPSLGAGQRLVIVVGRGTAYETKYAVKTITSSAAGSTLVVDSADKTFDNTPVTAAPAGTEVEHCWSATEASLANDHMRTKQAHGSDGDLVDQNTAQLLSNKTVMTPTASGHPTTKAYVDAADALLLPKAGGTMSGPIAMGSQKVTGLAAGTANGDAVRYEQALLLAGGTMAGKITLDGDPSSALHAAPKQYVDALGSSLGVYLDWTPALTASGTNPTNWTGSGRYQKIGKHVTGWGKLVAASGFTTGSGTWRIPLPVAPRQTTAYPRIGEGMVYNNNTWFAYIQLELQSSVDYTQAMVIGLGYEDDAGKLLSYSNPNKKGWQKIKWLDTTFMTTDLYGNDCQIGATISWKFDYEAA